MSVLANILNLKWEGNLSAKNNKNKHLYLKDLICNSRRKIGQVASL